MPTISLCMIVKNEEDTLSRCLESAADLVDEIIIVDTGSSDKTIEDASRFTEKIFHFKWIDDFSAARNFSFSKGKKDYIFWLDADDVLLEEDRIKFRQLKESLSPKVDAVMMKYNYAFDEHGNPTLTHYRERLVKRSRKYLWTDPIHEYLQISGNIINSDISITHNRVHNASGRNLAIFEKMAASGKPFSPRNLFYYAKELHSNNRIEEAIAYFEKFLGTDQGWVEDNLCACHTLALLYKDKKDDRQTLRILLKSMEYTGKPRAEICCELGSYYMDLQDYNSAIFWFELAAHLEKPAECWGFILHESWGFIPCLQLCVCYYRIGNLEESIRYNIKAAEYKPKDSGVLYNLKFFQQLYDQGALSEKAREMLLPCVSNPNCPV